MSQTVEVTVERINRFEGEGNAKAFCDVAIADSFLIKGISVRQGKNGFFVSMPRQQGKDGNWYDTFLPLTKEARQQICEVVLAAYDSQTQQPAP